MLKRLLITFAVCMSLLLIGLVAGYFTLQHWYQQRSAVQLEISHQEPALLTVPRGSNPRRIARQLEQEGYITPARLNEIAFRLFNKGSRVQAGVYAIHDGDSAAQIWQRIALGQQHLFSITFVEGSEFKQWQQQIVTHPYLHSKNEDLTGEQLAELLTNGEHRHIEGLLFPDTYRFYAGTNAMDIYRQAHRSMNAVVAELWPLRDRDVPVASPYEALILASIIEKETGAAHERELVASVFVNRLKTGMRLQSDPTIIYGLGENYRGVIYRSDIQQHTEYNTYRINGLPPTPIAMPGRAAITATLQPASSDYFYFVSRNDGTHVFSRTLTEHNRAVQRYQRN